MHLRWRPASWFVTALASLALHGLALWLLGAGAPTPPAPRAPPLELTWFETARTPEAQARPPTAPSAPQRAAARAPASTATPVAAGGAPPSTGGGSAGPEAVEFGPAGDLPLARGPSLTPRAGYIFSTPEAADAEAPRGTTVRNGPGEEPDPVIAREIEGDRLTRKLNDDLASELGAAAVAVGNVPGHFRRVESTLRDVLRGQPVDVTPKSGGDIARDVASLLFLNPGASPEAARRVTDSPLGRSLAAGTVPTPNTEDQRFRDSAMQMMGAIEALKEKAQAPRLRTVLELTTDASGALADVTVVERSGDARFDDSVMHLTRRAFRSVPDSDDKGLGTSFWRSRWQFTLEPPSVRVRLVGAHRLRQ